MLPKLSLESETPSCQRSTVVILLCQVAWVAARLVSPDLVPFCASNSMTAAALAAVTWLHRGAR